MFSTEWPSSLFTGAYVPLCVCAHFLTTIAHNWPVSQSVWRLTHLLLTCSLISRGKASTMRHSSERVFVCACVYPHLVSPAFLLPRREGNGKSSLIGSGPLLLPLNGKEQLFEKAKNRDLRERKGGLCWGVQCAPVCYIKTTLFGHWLVQREGSSTATATTRTEKFHCRRSPGSCFLFFSTA